MAIFNKDVTLLALDEMKTREEYARRSFKKKYNFEPDKPGSDTGTITDKEGKKYRVDMEKSSTMDVSGYEVPRQTAADLNDEEGKINLDKNFFKLKGSNKGERRDAMLQHEIGHQKLHNMNPNNTMVEDKNRNMKVFKSTIKNMIKDQTDGIVDISRKGSDDEKRTVHDVRKDIYDNYGAKEYASSIRATKQERNQREKDHSAAKKFERPGIHMNAEEYEADRHAANRTSESATKKGIRDFYKNNYRDIKDKNVRKYLKKVGTADTQQRSKALKDPDMRRANTYK